MKYFTNIKYLYVYLFCKINKMAVNPLNLTISLSKNSDCTSVLLEDVKVELLELTGNTDGYGLSGGPTVNNVDIVTITISLMAL